MTSLTFLAMTSPGVAGEERANLKLIKHIIVIYQEHNTAVTGAVFAGYANH